MTKNIFTTFTLIVFFSTILSAQKNVVSGDIFYRNDEVKNTLIPEEKLKNSTLIVLVPLYDLSKQPKPETGSKMGDKIYAMTVKKNTQDVTYWRKRLAKIMKKYPYKFEVMLTDEYEQNIDRSKFPYVLITRGEAYTRTKRSTNNVTGNTETSTSQTFLYHYVLMDARSYTLYYGPSDLKYHQSSLYGESLTATLKLLKKQYGWE